MYRIGYTTVYHGEYTENFYYRHDNLSSVLQEMSDIGGEFEYEVCGRYYFKIAHDLLHYIEEVKD